MTMQQQLLNIPEYLFTEAENFVLKELTMTTQMPPDSGDDSQNVLR